MQKQYGKTSANLETITNGFLWLLKDIPMPKILDALRQYVTRNNDIPAPADLMNIIDPPKEIWKPDWAVYIALKKKIQQEYYYPYSYEREFLKKCESYSHKYPILKTS